jgi:hypothetical protein
MVVNLFFYCLTLVWTPVLTHTFFASTTEIWVRTQKSPEAERLCPVATASRQSGSWAITRSDRALCRSHLLLNQINQLGHRNFGLDKACRYDAEFRFHLLCAQAQQLAMPTCRPVRHDRRACSSVRCPRSEMLLRLGARSIPLGFRRISATISAFDPLQSSKSHFAEIVLPFPRLTHCQSSK